MSKIQMRESDAGFKVILVRWHRFGTVGNSLQRDEQGLDKIKQDKEEENMSHFHSERKQT